jgi:hypothetical protein
VTGKNAHWTGTGASLAKQRRRKRSPTCKALQGAAFAPGTRRDPGAPAAAHHTLGESPASRQRQDENEARLGEQALRPSLLACGHPAPPPTSLRQPTRQPTRPLTTTTPSTSSASACCSGRGVSGNRSCTCAAHCGIILARDRARQGETGHNPRLHPEHEHVVVMLPFSQQIALPASPASPASNCHEVRLSHRRGGARV